jgi:hypothetical protein
LKIKLKIEFYEGELMKLYTSSANKNYREYVKWVNKNPVKFIEGITGVKFKWYQKIYYYFAFKIATWKQERKKKKYNKFIKQYMNV